MKRYIPFIATTEEEASRILDGLITFSNAISPKYGNSDNYLADVLSKFPKDYFKNGFENQVESGAIIDLSDFSSTILILNQFMYEDDDIITPDSRFAALGDTAVIIINPSAFVERLFSANSYKYSNLKHLYVREAVYDDAIYDSNLRENLFNLFVHREDDSWKREVVIISRVKQSVVIENDFYKGDYIMNEL